MDALRAEYSTVEILRKSDEYESDTDSTGVASEYGNVSEGKCIYNTNCDNLPYPPYVTMDGLICSEHEIIGTTRARVGKDATLFVWDWDDTLFPSSWINMQGMRLDDDYQCGELQRQELDALSAQVLATLQVAANLGTVVIVTNAEEGWVPLSCGKFMPKIQPIIDQFKVVSARTRYETPGVFSPLTWKVKCFEAEIAEHFSNLQTPVRAYRNVISLGDSIHEREALQRVAKELPCGSKTMKLPERPTLQDLIHCHELMRKNLPTLAAHDGDLDLQVRVAERMVTLYN
jgi:hypothetical protein